MIAWFIPKRLPAHELYVIGWYTAAFALVFDLLVGATLDLYDYAGSAKVTFADIGQIALTNPAIAIILLNFWPERLIRKAIYLAAWIAVLAALELLWLKLGYMKYKGWSIWYSLLSYPCLFGVLRGLLLLYRRLLNKAKAL